MLTLTPHQILVRVLKGHKPLSLTRGKYHPVFQALAQRHARELAIRDNFVAPHAGWGERRIELVSRAPESTNFGEIVAMAGYPDPETAAGAIYNEWLNSPPHWVMLNGPFDYWGYAMSQSRRNIWYAVGIVGTKR